MHYADGQEVKLGDLVRGKPYNTPHEVVGTVVGGLPESEFCNLRVAFVEAVACDAVAADVERTRPKMATGTFAWWPGNGGKMEPRTALWACCDYGDTKGFSLLARAAPLV